MTRGVPQIMFSSFLYAQQRLRARIICGRRQELWSRVSDGCQHRSRTAEFSICICETAEDIRIVVIVVVCDGKLWSGGGGSWWSITHSQKCEYHWLVINKLMTIRSFLSHSPTILPPQSREPRVMKMRNDVPSPRLEVDWRSQFLERYRLVVRYTTGDDAEFVCTSIWLVSPLLLRAE